MTDRYKALLVVLEDDIREDDARSTISAIEHIKGVLKVHGHVTDPVQAVANARAIQYWRQKMIHMLFEESHE